MGNMLHPEMSTVSARSARLSFCVSHGVSSAAIVRGLCRFAAPDQVIKRRISRLYVVRKDLDPAGFDGFETSATLAGPLYRIARGMLDFVLRK